MDTYHKMLVKMHESAGGRESVDVDFVEIAKREGYFPSIDEISSYLVSESWVTESRPNVLRLTHWGIAEVRKTQAGTDAEESSLSSEKAKLAALAAGLGNLIDGLDEKNVSDSIKKVIQAGAEIVAVAERIKL
ncbi:MAG TPA: hypothetical protein PKA82_14555 [Pyrinomonadaceae bacterium]|nr:hypothetical protein [Pyrinomonadaceae bacterium]